MRKVSSSGGIFTIIAEKVLEEGGVVCGAAFDKDYNLSHVVVDTKEDLEKLRSSKYIQSVTGKTYTRVRRTLEDGRSVVYAGCGCQIAGLNRFLGKKYDNLITIDLLCHGGPTPGSFKKYMDDVHKKKKVSYVGFRDKDVFKWEINSTGMTVKYQNGKEYRKSKGKDPFYRAFTRAFTVRPHCQTCNYAALPRQGDITLGDFWGVVRYNPDFNDDKGTSLILVNSEKGMSVMEKIRSELKLLEPVPLDLVMKLGQPIDKPFHAEPLRDRFMKMSEYVSFRKCLKCCASDTFDYAYYALKPKDMKDVLKAYESYKLMSKANYSVLLVWDRSDEGISPLKYEVDEFIREHFPAFVEIRNPEEGKKLQERCRNFAFSSQEYLTWGRKNLNRRAKKVNLTKILPEPERFCQMNVQQQDKVNNRLKNRLRYNEKRILHRVKAGIEWRVRVFIDKLK